MPLESISDRQSSTFHSRRASSTAIILSFRLASLKLSGSPKLAIILPAWREKLRYFLYAARINLPAKPLRRLRPCRPVIVIQPLDRPLTFGCRHACGSQASCHDFCAFGRETRLNPSGKCWRKRLAQLIVIWQRLHSTQPRSNGSHKALRKYIFNGCRPRASAPHDASSTAPHGPCRPKVRPLGGRSAVWGAQRLGIASHDQLPSIANPKTGRLELG